PSTVSPVSTFHTLTVSSSDPLSTRSPSPLLYTSLAIPLCPVHLEMIFRLSMSHNFTFPSRLPLATVLPFGDNAIVITPASSPSSRQSLPICAPLFVSHSRSEPSSEHVMICRLPGRCAALQTVRVCPRIVWRGFVVNVFFILALEDMADAARLSYRRW